jgi:AbrB family looped-hinge helix DNA binding protein
MMPQGSKRGSRRAPSADSSRVIVGRQGRVVIPAEVRKALRVEEGDELIASVEEGRLVLRPDNDLDEKLWAMCGHVKGDLVAELLRERRAEAAREEKE